MAIGPENSGKVGGGGVPGPPPFSFTKQPPHTMSPVGFSPPPPPPRELPVRLSPFLLLPQVILTGDVSGGSRGGRIFRSSDFAKNFIQTDLPFHPLVQITYHPQNSDCLLALSTEVRGWEETLLGDGRSSRWRFPQG